jgi:hypothetical protein
MAQLTEHMPNTGYSLVPYADKSSVELEKLSTFDVFVETSGTNGETIIESNLISRVEWHQYPSSVTVYIPKQEPYILRVGDFITYEGRQDTGAVIVEFHGDIENTGPNGFRYLPWRDEPDRDNGRWASVAFTLRGDSRFVICPPCGVPFYGLHINLKTIKIINHLAPINNSKFMAHKAIMANPYFQNMSHSLHTPVSEPK